MFKKLPPLLTLCIFFYCLSLSSAEAETAKIIEDKAALQILNPSFDARSTLKIELANGLQAFLISDPNVEKSSATLVVKTGSWEDPTEYPGIAHFLEHMLFLGTKKYPNESEYDRFISEHNGLDNAFTSNDFTGYVFTVSNNAFPEALDRFASFFTAPLFNPSGVDRELQAIDQEYAKNIENDAFREYYVLKSLTNPSHPNHAFSMGNRNSLLKVSQDTLKEWYQQHYSANRMRLEVISPLPIDQLKSLVIANFSEIPNKNLADINIDLPLLSDSLKGHMLYIEPMKNIRQLTISWDLPSKFIDMRDTKPEEIVGHILGHEGKKSLLAQLKKEKLAESLQAGGQKIGGRNFQFFIQIDLTDAGVKDLNTVILRCFETIANLKKRGIPQYIFDELRAVTKLNYQYQSREDAFEHILKEAMALPNEDMATYPEQTLVLQKFDPQAVQELLAALAPENAVYDIIAPKNLTGITFTEKEPWLNTPYTIKAISDETLNKWKDASPSPQIDLPEPNPYIPENIALISEVRQKEFKDGDYVPTPSLLLDSDQGKTYFAQDTYYTLPKVSWMFEIKTPAVVPSKPETQVLSELFVKYANEALSSYTYPAAMAGLNFGIQGTENGFSVAIDGYSDKAEELFLDLINTIKDPHPREQKFKVHKDTLLRQYQDVAVDMPLVQDYEILKSILYKDFATAKAKAAAIRKITFDQLEEFIAHLFDKTYIEGVIYGNMTDKQAQHITDQLVAKLASQPYPKQEQPKKEVIVLPKDQGPYFVEMKSKVQGNALLLSVQLDDYTFKRRAAQQVLMQAIKQPFFSTIRTKQQTGYIVFSQAEDLEQHLFNTFGVQSNTHDGRDLLARFEQFIEDFLQEMSKQEITLNRFDNIKQSLLTTLRQPPQSMTDMTVLLYKFAFSYDGDFNWLKKRIKAFDALTYQEFLDEANAMLGKTNKRRLAVIMVGEIPKEESLEYKRLCGPAKIRQLSSYEPASQENSHE